MATGGEINDHSCDGLGFLLWLAVAAAFRFGGQYFFVPDESLRMVTSSPRR
jgi:hypothetical protein